jgi:hypothetical protein
MGQSQNGGWRTAFEESRGGMVRGVFEGEKVARLECYRSRP